MKKKTPVRTLALCLTLVLAACLFAGCGAASAPKDSPLMNETMAQDVLSEESGPVPSPGSSSGLTVPDDGRKVILTGEAFLESKEYDKALDALLQRTQALGGYVAAREEYAYSSREIRLTLRIPSDRFSEFVSGLGGIANVTRLQQASEDVTESYIETESYLESLRTQQSRLLELMDKAESLEDMLAIEARLAEVRAQLQYYATLKNSYDNRITYARLEVQLAEVKDYSILEPTFGDKLWSLLKNTAAGFVGFLEGLLFFLIGAAPYLALAAAVLFPLLHTLKKRRARKAAAKAAPKVCEEKEKE